MRGSVTRHIPLKKILSEVVKRRSDSQPVPQLDLPQDDLIVQADREQLANVFAYLIQNAQEATKDDGTITVRLKKGAQQAIIEIEDNGSGMDADFIQNRLFRPFDSTKGLTGMGIGVFESREVVRGIGGDIGVQSSPGEGTLFRITIPAVVPTAIEESTEESEA